MKTHSSLSCLLALISFAGLATAQPVIEQAEYYFNSDPGPGNGTAISVPAPNESPIDISFDIPAGTLAALDDGWHKLVVRFKDNDGDWSVAMKLPEASIGVSETETFLP
ncbi:MAG: hypothetical protein O3C43_16405 [Verrucomicrobia bacterium]|nr:hypothetical protein [Verrucomicrobiota bacterium]